MPKHLILDVDYRNRRCRVRVRLTLLAILVLAAIVGNLWSRRFVDRYLGPNKQSVEKP